MKKIICLLLLLFLLCSCAKVQQAEESEPSLKESEPQAQEPEQVTPTSQQIVKDENGNVFFSVDKIKELEDRQENYSRYYDEFVSEFIPGDDYGTVMPFIGRFAEGKEGNHSYEEERVGFCTADGKIICDAVYDFRGALSTDNYIYYLMRCVGVDDIYDSEAYMNSRNSIWTIIREDGKKMLKLTGAGYNDFSVKDNKIKVFKDVISNDEFLYEYYNEELDAEPTISIEKPVKNTYKAYNFYCPICESDAATDYPEYSIMWKKGEDNLIGYIHKGCNEADSVISADGEYLFSLPHSYTANVYGIDEDYAWGYYFDSMEYDDTKIKAYIYDRNTKTMHILDNGSFYFRVSDTEFYFLGQDPETNDSYCYIYDVSTGGYTECDGSLVFGNGVSYCYNGKSYVKDTNLNEIMSLNILTD